MSRTELTSKVRLRLASWIGAPPNVVLIHESDLPDDFVPGEDKIEKLHTVVCSTPTIGGEYIRYNPRLAYVRI